MTDINEDLGVLKLAEFFNNKKYQSVDMNSSFYIHNILQYQLKTFLKNNDYKIVDKFYISKYSAIVEPKMSIAYSSPGKSFTIYIKAFIFMENKKTNERIALFTSPNYDGSMQNYSIFALKSPKDFWEKWLSYSKQNNFYKGQKINPLCNFLELNKKTNWDSIIIAPKIKKVIKRNVHNLYSNRDILAKNKISIKRGIILCGVPGTGKTMLCKVLANEMPMTIIYVLPSDIRRICDVSRICEMAKDLSPTLLILEDIDYIAEDRDFSGHGGNLCIELMNRMDGLQEEFKNVITIATTNMIDKVEKAIKNRPGRFDKVIEVDVPAAKEREKMIEIFTKSFKLHKDVDIKAIVKKTKGMPGAFIFHISEYAAILAIEDKSMNKNDIAIVKQKHFEEAIEELKDKDFGCGAEYEPKEKMGFH
jgi:SpoVK/Ycf46/Vps4 family AAA+-type ATPase